MRSSCLLIEVNRPVLLRCGNFGLSISDIGCALLSQQQQLS
jgi:hypothetical protein